MGNRSICRRLLTLYNFLCIKPTRTSVYLEMLMMSFFEPMSFWIYRGFSSSMVSISLSLHSRILNRCSFSIVVLLGDLTTPSPQWLWFFQTNLYLTNLPENEYKVTWRASKILRWIGMPFLTVIWIYKKEQVPRRERQQRSEFGIYNFL